MERVSLGLATRIQRKKVPLVGLVREDNKSPDIEREWYIGHRK